MECFAARGVVHVGSDDFPAIITASEESLHAVPKGLREGSLALGATAGCGKTTLLRCINRMNPISPPSLTSAS
jgi:ABC-type phosphate transport system ATPase subunit